MTDALKKCWRATARQTKWLYQRLIRGWDDRETWGLDGTLGRFMVPRLQHLRTSKKGIPIRCFSCDDWDAVACDYKPGAHDRAQDRWFAILDEMIEGFSAVNEWESRRPGQNYREWEQDKDRKVQRAFDLLAQYHGSLWD